MNPVLELNFASLSTAPCPNQLRPSAFDTVFFTARYDGLNFVEYLKLFLRFYAVVILEQRFRIGF
jgi:hypothetical protein